MLETLHLDCDPRSTHGSNQGVKTIILIHSLIHCIFSNHRAHESFPKQGAQDRGFPFQGHDAPCPSPTPMFLYRPSVGSNPSCALCRSSEILAQSREGFGSRLFAPSCFLSQTGLSPHVSAHASTRGQRTLRPSRRNSRATDATDRLVTGSLWLLTYWRRFLGLRKSKPY